MPALTAAMMFLVCSVASATMDTRKIYVGLQYSERELPEGCRSVGGTIVGKGIDSSILQITCNGTRFVVFNRLAHKDANGRPHWEVVDLVSLPPIGRGESINDLDCVSPLGGYTLTIAKWRHTKVKTYAYRILHAIHLNLTESKFEVINPTQVKCEYFEDRD